MDYKWGDSKCKGCNYLYSALCTIKVNTELTSKCPCNNCIVKMMCAIKCEQRKNYYSKIDIDKKADLKKRFI
jgi:hypothetical protein